MKRCVSVLLVWLSVVVAATAWAGDGDDDAPLPEQAEQGGANAKDPPPEMPEEVEAPEADTSEVDQQAWGLLERAMNALAARDEDAAKRYLERLHRDYPNHPAADASQGALETLGGTRSSAFPDSPDADGGDASGAGAAGENNSGIARAELAIFQTINGLAIGAELCGVAQCDDPRLVIGSLAGGAGLGLGLSLYASRNGITPGHVLALNSGTFWGFANGLFLELSLDQSGDLRRLPGLMAAGQLAGLGVGHLAYTRFKPDAGDVALMNSTGFWSGVFMMMINGIVEPENPQVFARSTLAAFDLGLVGGAFLAQAYPMSRGRAFVIDAAGLVGSLTGVGAYLFFTNGEGESRGALTSALVGGGTGLGLATFLTRKWDDDEDLLGNMQLMVGPSRDGKGATVGVGGRF